MHSGVRHLGGRTPEQKAPESSAVRCKQTVVLRRARPGVSVCVYVCKCGCLRPDKDSSTDVTHADGAETWKLGPRPSQDGTSLFF